MWDGTADWESKMLQNLFKSRHHEPEFDETLQIATQALMGRMESMLERDTVKKLRFATIDNTPSYYR